MGGSIVIIAGTSVEDLGKLSPVNRQSAYAERLSEYIVAQYRIAESKQMNLLERLDRAQDKLSDHLKGSAEFDLAHFKYSKLNFEWRSSLAVQKVWGDHYHWMTGGNVVNLPRE